MIKILIQRELLVYWRRPALLIQPILLFAFIVILFPLTLQTKNLALFAAPIAWIASLFAALLSLEALWFSDAMDGSLNHFFLTPISFVFLSIIKVFAHWFMTGCPIILLLPFIFVLYHIPFHELPIYLVSFSLGTLIVSLLGSMISSLLLYTKQAALLLPALLLPLFIPVTLLVNGLIQIASAGLPTDGIFLLLLSFFSFLFTVSPCVSAYILRLTIS